MNAIGTDISCYQNAVSTPQYVDFDKMKLNGASFVIIKASQANYTDRDIVWNWAKAKSAGLLRAAYHFLVWDVDPIIQADYFCDLVKYDPAELGLFADFEWWDQVPGNALAILDAFCLQVEKRVGKCGVYTAPGFWQPNGSKDSKWRSRPLWQAQWGISAPTVVEPWKDWVFWQTSNKGDGLAYGCESMQVDTDEFNGTVADLYKYAKVLPPVDSTVKSDILAEIEKLKDMVGKRL